MKRLNQLFFLIIAVLAWQCLADETVSIELKDVSVTPDHLTEKAENDAVEVGVVEFVVEETETAETPEGDAEVEEVTDEESESSASSCKYLAGPAEMMASIAVPLAFTGIGAGAGIIPSMNSYAGMAITPFTTVAGAGVGAVGGTIFCPFLLLKGLFDSATLGAFVDDDYDVTDSADVVEEKVNFVNDILLLNDPFDEEEEETSDADEQDTEEEPTPEEETEE